MTQAFSALPETGAVLDQPVWVVRMMGILLLGGFFEATASAPAAPDDPLAQLPMQAL